MTRRLGKSGDRFPFITSLSGQLVLEAMVRIEREHGGPRKLSTTDLARRGVDRTTGTIARTLRGDLRGQGFVVHVGHLGNGHQGWMLTPKARKPFGLPNDHGVDHDLV